jgi:hypothetical protein
MGVKEQIIFPEIDYDKIDDRGHGHHDHDHAKPTRKAALLRVQLPVQELRNRNHDGKEIDDQPRGQAHALVQKYAMKRARTQGDHRNPEAVGDESGMRMRKLQKLPRDASPTASATAAASPAGRMVTTASSGWPQQAA